MGETILLLNKKDYILKKDHLSYWLRQLRKNAELIAPKREIGGEIVLTKAENIHEIALEYTAPILAPKFILFPQADPIFRYQSDIRSKISGIVDTKKRVVFGVPPCGISAMHIADRVFGGRYNDPYYAARRENTTFITLGCNNPLPTCFCSSLNAGPFLNNDYDIQLTDLGDRFFVQVGSSEGKEIVKKYRYLFNIAEKADYDDQYEAVLDAQSRFETNVDVESYYRKLKEDALNDSFWERIAERCFECGGCTYLCPICLCFNVVDRPESESSGERIRVWDSCMFSGFTKMAGGVNPVHDKRDRIKRWHYHKILYYPEKYGNYGCVGCGLCAITCPGRIDMASVIKRSSEYSVSSTGR